LFTAQIHWLESMNRNKTHQNSIFPGTINGDIY